MKLEHKLEILRIAIPSWDENPREPPVGYIKPGRVDGFEEFAHWPGLAEFYALQGGANLSLISLYEPEELVGQKKSIPMWVDPLEIEGKWLCVGRSCDDDLLLGENGGLYGLSEYDEAPQYFGTVREYLDEITSEKYLTNSHGVRDRYFELLVHLGFSADISEESLKPIPEPAPKLTALPGPVRATTRSHLEEAGDGFVLRQCPSCSLEFELETARWKRLGFDSPRCPSCGHEDREVAWETEAQLQYGSELQGAQFKTTLSVLDRTYEPSMEVPARSETPLPEHRCWRCWAKFNCAEPANYCPSCKQALKK